MSHRKERLQRKMKKQPKEIQPQIQSIELMKIYQETKIDNIEHTKGTNIFMIKENPNHEEKRYLFKTMLNLSKKISLSIGKKKRQKRYITKATQKKSC